MVEILDIIKFLMYFYIFVIMHQLSSKLATSNTAKDLHAQQLGATKTKQTHVSFMINQGCQITIT